MYLVDLHHMGPWQLSLKGLEQGGNGSLTPIIAKRNEMYFVSEPQNFFLVPASLKLWHANLLAFK